MRAALPLLALAAPFLLSAEANAACGMDRILVHGTAEETRMACSSLAAVVVYFADLGFTLDPQLTISFRDEVSVDLAAPSHGELRVAACYDASRREIEITSLSAALEAEREPWGLTWGEPLASSVLEHEIVHAAIWTVAGGDRSAIGHAWSEFIAYAVQLELMAPAMREEILARHSDVRPFDVPTEVNRITHAFDPDGFGLRAYLFAEAHGGKAFIGQILDGEAGFETTDVVIEP